MSYYIFGCPIRNNFMTFFEKEIPVLNNGHKKLSLHSVPLFMLIRRKKKIEFFVKPCHKKKVYCTVIFIEYSTLVTYRNFTAISAFFRNDNKFNIFNVIQKHIMHVSMIILNRKIMWSNLTRR